ncbi:MAG: tRNA pseudouridine(38-40) synthase TruA [Devosiaceae bacterium]|nr:tRNA pseudouridine(38-40) synthase TruA [Devosiaceae bacterium]
MPRYRITLEYDGTPYVGWQRQPNHPSVQQHVEKAINGFSGEQVDIQAAGRTDAGVHAFGQVAHFDLDRQWDAFRVGQALNFHLKPQPIVVIACELVDDQFQARFSALSRHYLYKILNRRARPALQLSRVWHVPVELDAELMHEAAQVLVGEHDFTTFRAAECQAKSPIRTLDKIDVENIGEEIFIRVSARSFLHHQVRSITGSLKMVGEGKWGVNDLKNALEAKDRSWCGSMAPAAGLYLVSVDY